MEQQTVTPEVATPTPGTDPDVAKYEALRKEFPELNEPEAKAEPAPVEPEAKPEPEPEPQHVPRAEHENVQKALREARAAEQTAKAEKAAILQIIEQARQRQPEPKQEEPAKVPDKLEDPIAHYDARIAQMEKEIQKGNLTAQQATQQLQAWQQEQAMFHAAQSSEAELLKEKPDYWDACGHLESMRVAQLDAMFPDESPQVAAYAHQQGFQSVAHMKVATLENDRRAVLAHAMQLGVSPAQMYYDLAQKAGYQAKPNGKAVDVVPDKGKQQIAAAKRGQAASISISGGNAGRKGADDMSLTDLTAFFDEDPDAATEVMRKMAKMGRLG